MGNLIMFSCDALLQYVPTVLSLSPSPSYISNDHFTIENPLYLFVCVRAGG